MTPKIKKSDLKKILKSTLPSQEEMEKNRKSMIESFKTDPNNMGNWYPKVLGIVDTPKTILIDIDYDTVGDFINGYMGTDRVKNFIEVVFKNLEQVGQPAFLRSGIMSGKHSWEESCYLPDGITQEELGNHIYRIIEANAMAFGASMPTVFALRELIQTKAVFRAFWGKMPITKERRYFIKDGSVVCHHPYWPIEAFAREEEPNPNLVPLLEELNQESEEEIKELTELSLKVAKVFGGYYSVDWLQDVNGKWWLIDMAEGERSYHFSPCARKLIP